MGGEPGRHCCRFGGLRVCVYCKKGAEKEGEEGGGGITRMDMVGNVEILYS